MNKNGGVLADLSKSRGNIRVYCRTRPMNAAEKKLGEACCLEFEGKQTIKIKDSVLHEKSDTDGVKQDALRFNFDRVFDMESTQSEVFDDVGKGLVTSVLEGFNSTLFVYGQTSSGKTHTMQGPDISDLKMKGLIPRSIQFLFDCIENSLNTIEWLIKVSIYEIYMEKIRDLLDIDRKDLKIREDSTRGVYVQNLSEFYVSDTEEIRRLLTIANSNRIVASTKMNEASSRSHLLFQMEIYQKNTENGSAKNGRFFLIDLAGSEKISKTAAQGKTLEEAKKINLSLSALGNVINALTDGHSKHIPYRSSTLTRILQDSLGGNSKTSLIVTCSPSAYNLLETVGTLRFGQRAKSIKNTPKVNKEYTIEELMGLLQAKEAENSKLVGRVSYLESKLREAGIPYEADAILAEGRGSDADSNYADIDRMSNQQLKTNEPPETLDKSTETEIIFSSTDLTTDRTSRDASALSDLRKLYDEALERVESLQTDNKLLAVDTEEDEKEIELLQTHISQLEKTYSGEKGKLITKVGTCLSDWRSGLPGTRALGESQKANSAHHYTVDLKLNRTPESLKHFCDNLVSQGSMTKQDIAKAASYLQSEYCSADQLPMNQLQALSKTTSTSHENYKIKPEDANNEELFIECMKNLAQELNDFETDLQKYNSLVSEAKPLAAFDSFYRALIVKLTNSSLILKKANQELPKTMSSIVGRLEAIANPINMISDERKTALQLKMRALERQLISTQQQVDQYKKNCSHLTELIRKQPDTVSRDVLSRISSIGSTRASGLLSDAHRDLREVPDAVNGGIHPADELLRMRLGGDTGSPGLNNRSVVHSYLNRNPRIIKHIKGGIRKDGLLCDHSDALSVIPGSEGLKNSGIQQPNPGKWSVLKLLQRLCISVEDNQPNVAAQALNTDHANQQKPNN